MFCHQCGSGVSDDALTCGSCGADLRAKRDDGGVTQAIPAPDATIRMAPVTSLSARGGPATPAPLPPTTILSPTAVAAAVATSAPAPPAGAHPPARSSAPLVLLFGAAVLLGIAGWGGYRWFVQHRLATPEAAASPTPSQPTAAPAAAPPDSTPMAAPAPPPAADATPAATPAAPAAEAAAPSPAAPTPAQLAGIRRERDAAMAQRDAALDQVKQLRDDLARARAASVSPAPPAPVTTPVPGDAARAAQLQKEQDTVRFVIGSRKQLVNDKVIDSHLYMLPPPTTLTPINLSQTTEVSFDAKSYGVNKPKDVVMIPSSVWENTDFRISIAGSTVKFTILRPDAFRNFARYFVLMIE